MGEDRRYWNTDAPRTMTLRALRKLAPANRCECTDCNWRGNVNDLDFPRDHGERLTEGEPMWAGDCPRCLELVNSDGQLETWAAEEAEKANDRAAWAALAMLIEAMPAPKSRKVTEAWDRARLILKKVPA